VSSALAPSERLLATFFDLVRIYSPSTREADCAAYCEAALVAEGCEVRYDDADRTTGSNVGNLIAELPGTAPGTLVLSAHLDTVEPGKGVDPVVEDGVIFAVGDTVLGADDKAGLAAAIECVRRLVGSGEPRPTLRCVFTVQEEVGLVGAKALHADEVAGDLCLVLDADGEVGGIVVGAPTHFTFRARYFGRASHAGVAPERGVSAIEMAAEAISRLRLGRLDGQTTANIGTVAGGTATNVVAAETELTGECRSLDRERVEALRETMERTMREVAQERGGRFEIAWQLEYEGFSLAEDSSAVRVVTQACADAGLVPKTMTTGGGSDANIIAALGAPAVALSCGMRGVHSIDEHIAVADLEALARLCVSAARRLVTEVGDRP
jgi:tripeptide aminopeptidase